MKAANNATGRLGYRLELTMVVATSKRRRCSRLKVEERLSGSTTVILGAKGGSRFLIERVAYGPMLVRH